MMVARACDYRENGECWNCGCCVLRRLRPMHGHDTRGERLRRGSTQPQPEPGRADLTYAKSRRPLASRRGRRP